MSELRNQGLSVNQHLPPGCASACTLVGLLGREESIPGYEASREIQIGESIPARLLRPLAEGSATESPP